MKKSRSKSPLGDTRLDAVQDKMVTAMIERQQVILRQLSDNRKEEVSFHRFLKNDRISPEKIIAQFRKSTVLDFTNKHILIVEDSSDICFGLHEKRGNMGYVAQNTTKTGFTFHPSIYMDAENGACYGLASLQVLHKDYEKTMAKINSKEKKPDNRQIPFEEKQSYKWYRAAEQAIANGPGAAKYTIVADRESDIYDAMSRFKDKGWDFLLRSSTDRVISTKQEPHLKLSELVERWNVEEYIRIPLRQTKKRTAHQALVEVRFGSVQLLRPANHIDKKLPQRIEVSVIDLIERPSTVVGQEQAIHWRLLSSHPVTTIEQALHLIQCYCWRWVIEEVFRTLKTKGLNIEKSEVEQQSRLVNLGTLALLAAVQVLQLVQARDGKTHQNINSVFTPLEVKCLNKLNQTLEGKTSKQKNPHPPNTLAFASWVIARLGGWKGYQKHRPPGPITMRNGLVRFYNILIGFNLLL